MYISSVCIKVKIFSYKNVCFFNYQRAGVSFSTFLVLCCNQLSIFDLYCLIYLYFHFGYGVALSLSLVGINPGHLFHGLNQLLQSMIRARASVFALSWVNKKQQMSF